MRGVQQSTQRPCRRTAQTPDHVRKANRIGAAPRDKRELYNPIKLPASLVVRLPVSVYTQRLAAAFINADNVRLNVITKI